MKYNTTNKVIGFADSFYCLPANQLKVAKSAICSEMGWCESTFNSKRNGTRPLTNPERALLKVMFEGYNIEF